jgi:predicted metalloprotease
MLWKNRRQSSNVVDRRGFGPRGGGIALGGGGLLVVLALALLFGQDPLALLSQLGGGGGSAVMPQGGGQSAPTDPHEEELREFVSVVLADTEDIWAQQFARQGLQYHPPTLILFSGAVESACGQASAAVGPFYCPGDQSLYLDLSFLDELGARFNAAGDFPGAYVIAHEVGHHIQNELGTIQKVDSLRSRMGQTEANALSVRLELQADFYAGVWAHYAQKTLGVLEPGDIEEALNAASAIGDDRLQQQGQGYVVPDSFTHGTSEQRMRWFRKGYESGDMSQGDTFNTKSL